MGNCENFAGGSENYFLLGTYAVEAKAVDWNTGDDFSACHLPDTRNQRGLSPDRGNQFSCSNSCSGR